MELKIKKLHPDAKLPTYGSEGAACFDLHACFNVPMLHAVQTYGDGRTWPFKGHQTFNTGLAFEVPSGWVMLIFSRSGQGFGSNVRLANCVGVIDSDYRGEVMVKLTRDDGESHQVRNGDRIAQAMLVPVERVTFVEVDELSDTARGAGGLGSTGA
jgi:dUTP pyrophosphatase